MKARGVASESDACVCCGAPRIGPFCATCGQPEVGERHTVRSLLVGVLHRFVNLERGFVHTAYRLSVGPSQVLRDYIAGRTVPYSHPAGYLLIGFAAFTLSARYFGGAVGDTSWGNRLLAALLVPFVAGVSRLLFWRWRLNYAEHLIVGMYLFGQVALFLALVQVAVPFVDERVLPVLGFGGFGLGLGYYVWAWSRFFEDRPVLGAGGAVAALVAGGVLWMASVGALIHLLRTAL